ncbi:MAG: SusC/RagA family TonB-linked outer membrane protein, partial [Sphingobacteriaceae bacterium]
MKKITRGKLIIQHRKAFKIFFIFNAFLFLLSISLSVSAQAVLVQGKVTDDLGKPLYGVSVTVKSNSKGTQTDTQGNYSINSLDPNTTIIFSYVGFESQEVRPHGNTSINIRLKANPNSSDAVVVVGYGVIKKSSLTGAVSKIDNRALNTLPTSNV